MTMDNPNAAAPRSHLRATIKVWRTRRYWRVRERRQARYRFAPYASTNLVRFFIQRPSGYMSVYSLSGALQSTRRSRSIDGYRDPL